MSLSAALTSYALTPWLLSAPDRAPEELGKEAPEPAKDDGAVAETVTTLITTVDLVGVLFFAISGAVLAVRKGYDIMGSLMLCLIVGTTGGIIRDLIINEDVPAAFRNPAYLVLPAVAMLLVFFRVVDRNRGAHTVMIFDAIGLSVYCVIGTRLALIGGIDPLAAVFLGLISAVGGGIVRDVVAGEPPAVFGGRGWYGLPALVGASLTALLGALEWLTVLTSAAVMLLVLALRLFSVRQEWRAPAAEITGEYRDQRESDDEAPPVEDVRDREGEDGGPAAPGEPEGGEDGPEGKDADDDEPGRKRARERARDRG